VTWPAATEKRPAPNDVNVILTFDYKGCPITIDLKSKVAGFKKDAVGGRYHLDAADLEAISKALLEALGKFGPFDDDSNPLKVPFTTTGIVIVPLLADGRPDPDNKKATAENQIELKFECSIK